MGLSFKKIPFHLGINQFVLELDHQLEYESNHIIEPPKFDSNEYYFPCPLHLDLSTFFFEHDDFIP